MRAGIAAACLLGWEALLSPALAATVDFESSLYIHDKTIDQVDGWSRSSLQGGLPENFKTFAENGSLGGNKWMRVSTAGVGTLFREFPTNGSVLDLQWKWRPADAKVDACFGVSAGNDNARAATRALTCFHPEGNISVVELLASAEIDANATWTPGATYHLRMRLDHTANSYTVFMAADSLRSDEVLIAGPVKMAGVLTSNFTRVVVRAENGNGFIDLDDVHWEPVAYWKGTEDSLAGTARNWSTNVVPDSQTQVVLGSQATRNLVVDKPMAVRSVSVESGFTQVVHFGANMMTLGGNGNFTGLKSYTSAAGGIRMSSPRGQSLIGPISGTLPNVLHDGTGTLRFDGRAVFAKGFGQTAGTLDLNKWDLGVTENLAILNGGPHSVRNLEGRTISSGRSIKLEGASASSLLSLKGVAATWVVSFTDSLTARFVELQGSRNVNPSRKGFASQSVNKGGNENWEFLGSGPVILAHPVGQTLNVGQTATLRVSVNAGGLPATFQWTRSGAAVPGAADSVLSKVLTLSDAGTYVCKVTTTAGSVSSNPAALVVEFMAPTATPNGAAFVDSQSVAFSHPVAGVKYAISRNGGPYGPVTGATTVIRETTTLKAVAVLGPDTSAAGSWEFTKSSLPQVGEPEIYPEPDAPFRESLEVTMAPTTPGSVIRFTLDGTDPTATSIVYSSPIRITASTVVSARAFKDGMIPSTVHRHAFVKALDKPTVTPPGGTFPDSQAVTLSLPATAGNGAIFYRVNDGSVLLYSKPIVLRETTLLKAFAVLGSTTSDTAAYTFIRQIEAPTATPKGKEFPDTVRIALASKVSGSEIRYTLDGRAPELAGIPYTGPFLLDSTAVVKAVIFRNGIASSATLTETYTLVPDSLSADPKGGDFTTGQFIQLSSTSKRAVIWYTLDGSAPGPGLPGSVRYSGGIRLDTSATLKAVAVAGQGPTLRTGRPISQTYTFIKTETRVLGPGETGAISSRYSLSNPLPGAPQVQYEVIHADSLKGIRGFRDIQFGLKVSLPSETGGFPLVRLAAPAGEERILYGLTPAGGVRYIASADTVNLPGTGTYFLGIDTLPPLITLGGESFVGDSTRIVFNIQDNVLDLQLTVERSDAPRPLAPANITSPELHTATLRAPAVWDPLWIKLKVSDRRNDRHFPADPTAEFQLARKSASALRSPQLFRIGATSDQPWDMVSIPLEVEGRLTLGALKEFNQVKGLSVRTWDAAAEKPRTVADREVLEPGMALWLGSPTSLTSLTLPPFQTSTRQDKGSYSIRLKKGWNQVANPTLRPLIWPFSRKGFGYVDSKVKGLHGFDPDLPGTGTFHADTLKPWKGYWVLNNSGKDTAVILRSTPVPQAARAKRGVPGFLSLQLGLDRLPPLSLGASRASADGLGHEDEPQPPQRSGAADAAPAGPSLWSARGRARLGTDWLRWEAGAVHAWRVIAAGNPRATDAGSARVEGLDLPDGYAAFAVSRSRGLKFPLSEGAAIPLVPGAADSLDVYVGPEAALSARLASLPTEVDAFRLDALPRAGGYSLSLALPHAASLRWTLWSPDGRTRDGASRSLAPGFYKLHRQGRSGPLPAGLYVLRVEWNSAGKSGALTRKLALP